MRTLTGAAHVDVFSRLLVSQPERRQASVPFWDALLLFRQLRVVWILLRHKQVWDNGSHYEIIKFIEYQSRLHQRMSAYATTLSLADDRN